MVVLRYADAESLGGWLVGYGADVVVLDPPEVRDHVLARLREVAAAHPAGTATPSRAVEEVVPA